MIGKLQGIIDYIGDDYVIIMTSGGVGYKVFVPQKPETRDQRPETCLFIETVVKEDSIRLFGFETMSDLDLFNKLTSVNGVGPRVGMAIMGTLRADILWGAIANGDIKTISSAPGVGKKVAEKIILELKGKGQVLGTGTRNSELLSALETLGYKRLDVAEIAQKITNENPDLPVEKLIPMALKCLI